MRQQDMKECTRCTGPQAALLLVANVDVVHNFLVYGSNFTFTQSAEWTDDHGCRVSLRPWVLIAHVEVNRCRQYGGAIASFDVALYHARYVSTAQ